MKFLVAKSDLKAALDVVSTAISSSGGDLTCHYLFRQPLDGSTDKVEVLTHSGSIAARSQFVAAIQDHDDGNTMFTIEGWRLNMWLRSKSGEHPFLFSYNGEDKIVTVGVQGDTKHESVEWASLDPSHWPFWDDSLKEASVTMKQASTERLAAALQHVHVFALTNETEKPEYCLCESRDGVIVSSDQKGASLVYSDLWEDSTFQVRIANVNNFVSFLNKHDKSLVSTLEDKDCTIFKCGDDYFLDSRPVYKFPLFNHPEKGDQRWWLFDIKELHKGILHLLSGARDKNDYRLIFKRPDLNGPVFMSMKKRDTEELCTVELSVLESGSDLEDTSNLLDIPAEGFMVSRNRLEDLISLSKENTFRMGVNVTMRSGKKVGYCRVADVKFGDQDGNNGDKYVTIAMWLEK